MEPCFALDISHHVFSISLGKRSSASKSFMQPSSHRRKTYSDSNVYTKPGYRKCVVSFNRNKQETFISSGRSLLKTTHQYVVYWQYQFTYCWFRLPSYNQKKVFFQAFYDVKQLKNLQNVFFGNENFARDGMLFTFIV